MAVRGRRTRRELAGDLALMALSAAGGLLLLITKAGAHGAGWIHGSSGLAFTVDAGIGAAATVMIWFRRRWPVGVALATVPPLILSLSAGLAFFFMVRQARRSTLFPFTPLFLRVG